MGSASFPSGHSTQAATFYGGLVLLVLLSGAPVRRKVIAVAAAGVVTMLVGVSRAYLGAHWASDVLGGYLLALVWLAALRTLIAVWVARPTRLAWRPPTPAVLRSADAPARPLIAGAQRAGDDDL